MKNVLYAATRGLYHDMSVCIKSLMCNTSVDSIFCLIEDDQFPYYLPPIVNTINVSDQEYIAKTSPNWGTRCTFMTLMRPIATKFLPSVSKVISLDCDTIFVANGDELFDIDVSDCLFAAASEPNDRLKPVKPYYNFGVTILNLDKIRNDHLDDIYINLISSTRYENAEQDLMSILCKDRILELDPRFNSNNYTHIVNRNEMVIRHFAAEKAWQSGTFYGVYQNMSWDEVENRWKENKHDYKYSD